ncbi:hypothetical protein OG756_02330 [Streptomyces sp. NBC_01310]|uniref:hypothetical protein n=1 Tax=Streptomyces sp. NBC_01310 TaxID=2903820 RepID=UPI0035B6916F|nr:hypothetical protein OG756_02330 [Streptomyces sp. NBC_01310]
MAVHLVDQAVQQAAGGGDVGFGDVRGHRPVDRFGAGRDPLERGTAQRGEGQERRPAVVRVGLEVGQGLADEIVGDALDPLAGDPEAAGGPRDGQRLLGDHAQQLPAGLDLPLGTRDRLSHPAQQAGGLEHVRDAATAAGMPAATAPAPRLTRSIRADDLARLARCLSCEPNVLCSAGGASPISNPGPR